MRKFPDRRPEKLFSGSCCCSRSFELLTLHDRLVHGLKSDTRISTCLVLGLKLRYLIRAEIGATGPERENGKKILKTASTAERNERITGRRRNGLCNRDEVPRSEIVTIEDMNFCLYAKWLAFGVLTMT